MRFDWPVYYIVYVAIGWIICLAMIPVVLRRQFAPGAAIAWLGIVFLHPYIGLALYMTVGETRLGPRRVNQHREIVRRLRGLVKEADPDSKRIHPALHDPYEPLIRQARQISGLAVLGENTVDFIENSQQFIEQLAAEIKSAVSEVNLLYYTFASDDTGKQIADALQVAAAKGVRCRVLADAVASRSFFHRRGLARVLRASGIEVAAALAVAPIRRRLPRVDLRNHRKLAIIDGEIAYCGSQNLINADYGGRHGAPWVDLTARYTGPVVNHLAAIFAEDWAFETGIELPTTITAKPNRGEAAVAAQVVPTGPDAATDSFRLVLLAAIQCAREKLTLTTPYFVPDETTLVSMVMAANRGVEVTLIVPQTPDHPFTAAAGRAHYGRLMEAGVRIFQYQPGLIHAKTTTVDGALAIVGSANLDVRSFNLNFELSVLIYGAEAAARVHAIQMNYLSDSKELILEEWRKRSIVKQYAERALSLLSPLL